MHNNIRGHENRRAGERCGDKMGMTGMLMSIEEVRVVESTVVMQER